MTIYPGQGKSFPRIMAPLCHLEEQFPGLYICFIGKFISLSILYIYYVVEHIHALKWVIWGYFPLVNYCFLAVQIWVVRLHAAAQAWTWTTYSLASRAQGKGTRAAAILNTTNSRKETARLTGWRNSQLYIYRSISHWTSQNLSGRHEILLNIVHYKL